MIKRIDRFLNCLLYSLYKMLDYFRLFIDEIVDWLFLRPLYSLQCVRKRLKKNGFNTFDDWSRGTTEMAYRIVGSPTSGFTLYFLGLLSFALISLPIFLFINLLILVFGWAVYHTLTIHPIVITSLGVIPAWILSDFIFWKKDRYLSYFAIFEKESRKKKIAWAIAAFFGLLLLIVANFFVMWCAIQVHGDFYPLH